jgi:hypothetical protein
MIPAEACSKDQGGTAVKDSQVRVDKAVERIVVALDGESVRVVICALSIVLEGTMKLSVEVTLPEVLKSIQGLLTIFNESIGICWNDLRNIATTVDQPSEGLL